MVRLISLAALVLVAAFSFSSTATAADCNFEGMVDAKVVRFAWPPAVGVNVGFVDFAFGYSPPFSACGNATANVLGGICLIPKVGDLLGSMMCPVAEPEEE